MLTQDQEQLASKISYFCNSRFISGRIMEYDIKAANISMLREANMINDDFYQYLLYSDKQYREQFIGMQEKREMEESKSRSSMEGSITYKTIYEGIKQAKLQLFDSNNIQLNEVIRIANDAVYINRPVDLEYTKFGQFIEFKQKIVAESVIKLSSTIILFFWHNQSGLNIEVKGINDYAQSLHQNYMLSVLGSIMLTYERAGVTDAIKFIEQFYDDYINLRLDKEFYRELSPSSLFRIINSGYYLHDVSNVDIHLLDISYNGNLIREFWKILISRYSK